MQWPASGGRLAVVWTQSGETHGPADQVHGEQMAAEKHGVMLEGVEELANPDSRFQCTCCVHRLSVDGTFCLSLPKLSECPVVIYLK